MIHLYALVASVVVGLGAAARRKSADAMSSSSQQSSSRSTNLRLVAISGVSFFIGMQVKSLRELFGSTVGGANLDLAWAPQDFDAPYRPKKASGDSRRTRTETAKSVERAMQARDEKKKRKPKQQSEEKQHGKKKKKHRESRRFEASNYTNDFEPLPWTLPKPTRMQSSKEFMADYIAAKRKRKIPLPWEQKDEYADKAVSLPLPIIGLNFPKSATLTMKTYFVCGGITSVHTSTMDGRIGVCMMENQMADKPPMEGCDRHKPRKESGEIVPIDFISDIGLQGPPCYYSSLHDGGLENIAKHYPDATIMLVTRDATSWYRSMSKWGSIMHRWRKMCGFDGYIHESKNAKYWNKMYRSLSKEEYWVNFYHAHTQKVRDFAMEHLSMTYVEVELSDDMGDVLKGYTGVSPSCVMDCHPGPKWVKKHNATSRCHPVGENPALMKALPEGATEKGDNEDEEEGSGSDDDEKTDDDSTEENEE